MITSLLELAVWENKRGDPNQLGVLSTEPHLQPLAACAWKAPYSGMHIFGDYGTRSQALLPRLASAWSADKGGDDKDIPLHFSGEIKD